MGQVYVYCKVQKKVVPWGQQVEPPVRARPKNTVYIQQDSFDQPITMVGLPPSMDGDGVHKDVIVDSRSKRRQLLKEHNMIEMGNDAPKLIRETRERRAEEKHVDSWKRPIGKGEGRGRG
jgi:hypothetical protein